MRITLNHLLKTTCLCGIILLLTIHAKGQDGTYIEVRDLETWSAAGVKLKLNKDWEFGLSEQLRLKTNSSIVSSYFTEVDATYGGWGNWEVGAGLRFIRDNDTEGDVQGYENHLRFNMDLGYKHKVERLKLSYRFRYQNKNELGFSASEGDYLNHHVRFKLGLDYNIKDWKLDPKVSTELFRHFETGEINGFDKFRVTIGTNYKVKKVGTFKAFYRMERELNATYPKTTNIIGVAYAYTFKIKTYEQ